MLAVGLTAGMVGCARHMAVVDQPVAIDSARYRACFDAAVDVLRDNGFVVDRRDYRFGVITTRPLGSPTVLEPWHAHNSTADQAWESTFNDIRRRVAVRLAKNAASTDAGDTPVSSYNLEVEVVMERKQVPTRRLTGSAKRNVFSSLSAPPRELADKGVTGTYWEPIGRDRELESRLLAQILDRLKARKASQQVADGMHSIG
ncbi:MAG: hypothetical protein Kow00105_09050 [Phycisphaeraceae bacterium]